MEQQPKHTPGPWEVDNHGTPIIINGPEDAEGHNVVCTLDIAEDKALWRARRSAFAYPDEQQTANARLIAAAPDMAAALRAFLVQVIQGPVLERDAVVTEARNALKAAGVL